MNFAKAEWQQLAERWIGDAKALLDARRWSAAHYVAGYAVECGLKACVVARIATEPEVVFKDRKFSEPCWTHKIPELVELVGLKVVLDADEKANAVLRKNWLVAKDWRETSRYETTSHQKAKKLYDALTDSTNGVMPWIRRHW